jgi:hypothetical protein
MAQLTDEQIDEILDKSFEAEREGNKEECYRILKQIPISPWLARGLKEVYGKKLIEHGFNLSEAEAAYGKSWLD